MTNTNRTGWMILLLAAGAGGTAQAATGEAQYVLGLGLSLGAHSRPGRTLGGEVSLWRAPERSALLLGVDAGISAHTVWGEAEIAGTALEARQHQLAVVLGLGLGVVRAHEAPTEGLRVRTAVGFQATAWALVIPEMPMPLLPYARLEMYGTETVVGAGLMLKLALPLRPALWHRPSGA
jgi:hypothetical protein